MKFTRKQSISNDLAPRRALVIYGPRRVGKTTMAVTYLKDVAVADASQKTNYVTGDDFALREMFRAGLRTDILDFASPYDVIVIDEAQGIPGIGLGVKMIVDAYPDKKLILTGSSSFDLSREVGEPLTGRHFIMTLLPLAQSEMLASRFELKQALPDFLVYGSYPEVLLEPDKAKKQRILNELVSSYLFKDVLALDRIKSPKTLVDIVKCLAFQVGSEVSLNEISRTVGADVKTVGRYIDLLEKMFVVVRVGAYHRNLRSEIATKSKYYFLDNGVRNAVVSQFNGLESRDDVGRLWENFVAVELMKRNVLENRSERMYFWRTRGGQEIDLVLEKDGQLSAVECKWTPQDVSPPKDWQASYPKASFAVAHRENYLEMIIG